MLPFAFLCVGILLEWPRHRHLYVGWYFAAGASVVALLAVLCPVYAWFIAKSVDKVLKVAADSTRPNLILFCRMQSKPARERC
jgi:hypothetical protein